MIVILIVVNDIMSNCSGVGLVVVLEWLKKVADGCLEVVEVVVVVR